MYQLRQMKSWSDRLVSLRFIGGAHQAAMIIAVLRGSWVGHFQPFFAYMLQLTETHHISYVEAGGSCPK